MDRAPVFGGIFSRLGVPGALYIGELAGVFLIFISFVRAKTPMGERCKCRSAQRQVISRISLSVQHLQSEEIRDHRVILAPLLSSGAAHLIHTLKNYHNRIPPQLPGQVQD